MSNWVAPLKTAAIAACLLSGALAGCRTSGPRGVELAEIQRSNATVVASFNEVQTVPIVFDDKGYSFASIDHAELRPQYAFKLQSGEQQLVQLFKLPLWVSPFEIRLASYAMGGLAEPTLYYPKLVFLNSEFKPVRSSKLSEFAFRNIGSQGAISATYFVNQVNRNEVYIAITNESRTAFEEQLSMLQTTAYSSVSIPVKGGMLFLPFSVSGNEPPKKMRASETGYVELTFFRPR